MKIFIYIPWNWATSATRKTIKPDLSSGAAGIFGLEYVFSSSFAIAISGYPLAIEPGRKMEAAPLDVSESQFLLDVSAE